MTMLMEMTMAMMFISLMVAVNSKNPVKSSFFILLMTGAMMLTVNTKTGTTWMPLILFILFTGGILLMFMFLASILPNEKTMKIKIPKWTMMMMMMLTSSLMSSKCQSSQMTGALTKSFLTSSLNLTLMISIILLYFFCSMSLNTTEEHSMRSLQCK